MASKLNEKDLVNTSVVSEQSSLGILTAEQLANQSGFPNVTSSSNPEVSSWPTEKANESWSVSQGDDELLFRRPLNALPISLLRGSTCHPESLNGSRSTSVNCSQVDWSRLLSQEQSGKSESAVHKENMKPHCSFEQLRRDDNSKGLYDSFFDGQFSARSTSIGGSSIGSTRHFDDLSLKFPNRPTSSLLFNGPEEFSGLYHNDGLDVEERFETQDNLALINEAEREFNKEQELSFVGSNPANFSCLNADGSSSSSGKSFLSKSIYFMQNSSKIGSLQDDNENDDRTALRPTFGMSALESNGNKKINKNDNNDSSFRKNKKNVPTIANPSEKAELKMPSEHTTRQINEGSTPTTIQDLMRDLGNKKKRYPSTAQAYKFSVPTLGEPRPPCDIGNNGNEAVLSESQLLPSFLEKSENDFFATNGEHENALQALSLNTMVANPLSHSVEKQIEKMMKDKVGHTSSNTESNDNAAPKRQVKETTLNLPSKLPVRSPSPSSSNKSGSRHLKSGIPLPSPKPRVEQRIKAQRFSSPIKNEPKKEKSDSEHQTKTMNGIAVAQTTSANASVNSKMFSKSSGPSAFPIVCDYSSLAFLSVKDSCEKVIAMANIWTEGVVVKCILRHAPGFSLIPDGSCSSTSSLCITLEFSALEKKFLRVRFTPTKTSVDAVHEGKLVLKPQRCASHRGTTSNQPTFKGSISLFALSATPCVEFGLSRSNTMADYSIKMPSDETNFIFSVTNNGSAPAFVSIQERDDSFTSNEKFKDGDDQSILVNPDYFVLREQSTRHITVCLHPPAHYINSCSSRCLIVHTGPEVIRQALKKALQFTDPENSEVRSQLGQLGFLLKNFDGEDNIGNTPIQSLVGKLKLKVKECVRQLTSGSQLKKLVVDVDRSEFEGMVSDNTMMPLVTEETLSESRMDTSTVAMVPKTSVLMPPIKESNITRTIPSQTSNRGLFYLEQDELKFPDTKFGAKSLTKLMFKNKSKERKLVKIIRKPLSPFECRRDSVVVQPLSFLSLPIHFNPIVLGPNKSEMTLDMEGRVLVVSLKGTCVK